MKSGNLNFLEHSGPLQACNGTALPENSVQVVTIFSTNSTTIYVELSRQFKSSLGRTHRFSSLTFIHRPHFITLSVYLPSITYLGNWTADCVHISLLLSYVLRSYLFMYLFTKPFLSYLPTLSLTHTIRPLMAGWLMQTVFTYIIDGNAHDIIMLFPGWT